MFLEELTKIIEDRKVNRPEGSYIAGLFKQGRDRLIQKVGEEAVEVVIAAKNEDKQQTIYEISDLFFHTMILMSDLEITLENIENELKKRHPVKHK